MTYYDCNRFVVSFSYPSCPSYPSYPSYPPPPPSPSLPSPSPFSVYFYLSVHLSLSLTNTLPPPPPPPHANPPQLICIIQGLNLETVGGSCIMVDDNEIDISKTFIYKGVMVSDVPNFALTMGYTNASWTLKLDLTCTYVCRVLNYMQRNGLRQCCPRTDRAGPSKDPSQKPLPLLDFSSGYITRSIHRFPKQGPSFPWKLNQNYFRDLWGCSFAPVVEKFIEFK